MNHDVLENVCNRIGSQKRSFIPNLTYKGSQMPSFPLNIYHISPGGGGVKMSHISYDSFGTETEVRISNQKFAPAIFKRNISLTFTWDMSDMSPKSMSFV